MLGLLVFAALATCAACSKRPQAEVIVAGSTSVHPFVEMVAEKYMETNPDMRVVVQAGGSTAGVQAVREGAAHIGMCSRPLHEQEQDLAPGIVIAHDGLAVIVHPSNPIEQIQMEHVRGIFAGRIKDWQEIGGKKGPIRPVTREEGSGTRGAFQELVMGKEAIAPEAMVQDSNGSVREAVANDPAGIGYMSLGLVNPSVKAIRIGAAAPTRENVKNGSYPLARPFLFVTKGPPTGAAKAFIDFVLGPEGQKLLEEEGLVGASR